MSISAWRKRTFAWAIVCWRKMDEVGIPFYYSSHSKQNSSLCFDRQIFQVWTPKPAALYQILTIWGLIINLNLKCGESLMVFSQVFYDTSRHFWHFCTKVRALHSLELNSNTSNNHILCDRRLWAQLFLDGTDEFIDTAPLSHVFEMYCRFCFFIMQFHAFHVLYLSPSGQRAREWLSDGRCKQRAHPCLMKQSSEIIYLHAVRPTQWNLFFASVQK